MALAEFIFIYPPRKVNSHVQTGVSGRKSLSTLILDCLPFLNNPRWEFCSPTRSSCRVAPLSRCPMLTPASRSQRSLTVPPESAVVRLVDLQMCMLAPAAPRNRSSAAGSECASVRIDAHRRTTPQVRAWPVRRPTRRAGYVSTDRWHARRRDIAPRRPSTHPRLVSRNQPALVLRRPPPPVA